MTAASGRKMIGTDRDSQGLLRLPHELCGHGDEMLGRETKFLL
jgi:hypothetical protein